MEQLDLENAHESTDDAWWRRWREALGQEIDRLGGLKEVAYENDAKPSDMAHALAERDRHYFRGQWIVWLLRRSRALAQLAAEMHGEELSKKKPLTAEEKCKRYERELARLGEAGKAIKRSALEDE